MIKNCHSISNIVLHLVLVTKFRKKFMFKQNVLESAVISASCKIEKIGIASNHVHLLIEVPASRSVSKVVEIIKSVSSKKFMSLFPSSWTGWQVGYYIASVGRSSKSKVEKYLDNQ
jgi:putative transposase